VLDCITAHAGNIEARPDREGRKSGPMLDAAQPLLLYGGYEDSITQQDGGSVAVICIDAENVH
jgi:hypothetical protein